MLNLTSEQLIITDAIALEQQYGYKRANTFNFNNPDLYNTAYRPLLENDTEFLHLFGSAGSGKSRFAAQKEVKESFNKERRNRKTLVVRKVATTLKDSVYAELKTVIYEFGLQDQFEILKSPLQITNKDTGVVFLFIGLDDVEKVKSISGVDRIWIEEATELTTQNELAQLRLRLRGFSKVQITLTYNPINVYHWLNTDIHENLPDGHYIFKSTYRDNEKMLAVSPDYANYIEGLRLTNPNYYKVYGLGEWGQNAEGLIWPDYEVVGEMPLAKFYGLDIGYTDPCALVEGSIVDAPGRKDLFLNERLYMSGLTDADLIQQLEHRGISKDVPMVCDNASPATIEALRRANFYVTSSVKGADSVVAGIKQVLEYNIKILAGSKNMLREISNWSWQNKNGQWIDAPQDGAGHLMAATRYLVRAFGAKPRAGEPTYEQQREGSVPQKLRLENIHLRAPHQPPEQTERELRSHDVYAGLADMLRRKKSEDAEEESGYFSL